MIQSDNAPTKSRNVKAFMPSIVHLLPAVIACVFAGCLFRWPALAFDSLLQGFGVAFCRVIPAVFPIMVVSKMVVESPLANWLGLPLYPVVRALGMRERSIATVLFLGLLGGFAVLAQGIDQLYHTRRIDKYQAQLLLCAGLNTGPSFIILSVGYQMFGSISLGVLLLTASVLGNICAALLLRSFAPPPHKSVCCGTPQSVQSGFPLQGTLSRALQQSAMACVTLCSSIAFFALACAFIRQLFSGDAADLICALLEVTNGTLAAAAGTGTHRIYLALAALGWTGFSIQQQARILLPPEISLKSFYISRLFALPVSAIFFALAAKIFPAAVSVGSFAMRTSRFSYGIWVSFFLMVGAFLYECTPKALYANRKKEYN